MDILSYINKNNLIIAPVLVVIGFIIKNLEFIKDKYIPIILAIIAVTICTLMNGLVTDSFMQGILIAGVTVGLHQGVKQLNKAG